MNFSRREGYEVAIPTQLEGMDQQLRDDIFNLVYKIMEKFIQPGSTGYGDASYRTNNPQLIWENFFHKRVSEYPYAGDFVKKFESLYNNLSWHKIYDLIEFLIPLPNIDQNMSVAINKVLEKNNSPYRIVNNIVQPISSKQIIRMIQDTYNNTRNQETKNHLDQAEKLYSRKQDPEFNNSCLESHKALESCLRSIFNNQEILGDNIKKLKKLRLEQHILTMITQINAFRNDVSAHATKQDGYLPTLEDAILIHCMCCTFINYLTALKSKSAI